MKRLLKELWIIITSQSNKIWSVCITAGKNHSCWTIKTSEHVIAAVVQLTIYGTAQSSPWWRPAIAKGRQSHNPKIDGTNATLSYRLLGLGLGSRLGVGLVGSNPNRNPNYGGPWLWLWHCGYGGPWLWWPLAMAGHNLHHNPRLSRWKITFQLVLPCETFSPTLVFLLCLGHHCAAAAAALLAEKQVLVSNIAKNSWKSIADTHLDTTDEKYRQ